MPTLRNAADRAAILSRLDRLESTATPRWGKMTPPQMLAHIADAFRMALGDLTTRSMNIAVAKHFPVKHLVLYVLPFPKNVKTARELVSRPPVSFAAELTDVKQLAERLAASATGQARREHPLFGRLTPEEWGTLGYKHLDHHLTQFGL